MATDMPGAMEELSPQARPQDGTVQIQTGALGTSPLPYSRADFPAIPGDVSSPTSQRGGCRPPLSAEPSSEIQRGGKPSPSLGLGLPWLSPLLSPTRGERRGRLLLPLPARGREEPADAKTASSLSSDLSAAAPARWLLILAWPVLFGGQDEAEAARTEG